MLDLMKEMQEELMQDIQEGKIYALRCTKLNIDPHSYVYPLIFDVVRKITGFDENCFYVEGCEAYYGAFSYYDGNILKSTTEIPMAVDPEKSVLTDEFEVIRSY